MKNIYGYIKSMENEYISRPITIVDGYDFSQYETLRKCELYSNSRYVSGPKDSLGRKKRFFNIVNGKKDIAKRATDLDTKDIRIKTDEPDDFTRVYILEKKVRNWMEESNFAKFLNNAGETRPKYGGVLAKKTVNKGKLNIDVVEWRNTITDQTDIIEGCIVEKHFYTPSKLSKMRGVWDNIDDALALATDNKTSMTTGQEIKTPGKYIEIYEFHGDIPRSLVEEGAKEDEYARYFIICAGATKQDTKGEQYTSSVTLFSAEEKENPYKYLPWDKVPGRALGKGIIEEGFEAQEGVNDAKMKELQAMEIASKIIFKTDDNKVSKNALTDMDNGDVVKVSKGSDLTQVNTMSSSIPAFDNLVESWKAQFESATSTFAAISGETLPSGTPYRLGAVMNQEAGSIFDYRREEFGIWIGEIMEDWVLPHLLRDIKNGDTFLAEFSPDELKRIDDSFISKHLAQTIIEENMAGRFVPPEMVAQEIDKLKENLRATGKHRFLDIPKGYFDKIQTKISFETTGEQRNKAAMLETLSNIFQATAANPTVLQDPQLKKIFERLMEVAGINPIEIETDTPPAQPMMAPQGPVAQGGNVPQMNFNDTGTNTNP